MCPLRSFLFQQALLLALLQLAYATPQYFGANEKDYDCNAKQNINHLSPLTLMAHPSVTCPQPAHRCAMAPLEGKCIKRSCPFKPHSFCIINCIICANVVIRIARVSARFTFKLEQKESKVSRKESIICGILGEFVGVESVAIACHYLGASDGAFTIFAHGCGPIAE